MGQLAQALTTTWFCGDGGHPQAPVCVAFGLLGSAMGRVERRPREAACRSQGKSIKLGSGCEGPMFLCIFCMPGLMPGSLHGLCNLQTLASEFWMKCCAPRVGVGRARTQVYTTSWGLAGQW